MIDVPAAAEFVPLHLASMPIASAFAALADEAKQALVDDVNRCPARLCRRRQDGLS